MKTKFYKRLVPIALIASMAITNVGITSASAAEAATLIEQSVGHVFVGNSPIDNSDASDYKLAEDQTVTAKYEGTGTISDDAEATVKISFANTATLSNQTAAVLYLSSSDENATKVTGLSFEMPDPVEANKLVLKVKYSAVKDIEESGLVLYLAGTVVKNGNDTNKVLDDVHKITLKKSVTNTSSGGGSNPVVTTPVAAGDAFQIPGGLGKDKQGNVSSYKVGVAKVVNANAYNAASDKSALVSVAEITNDTTLGTWAGDYKGDGTASEQKLKPAAASAIDQYVLYYIPNGGSDKIFVRCLNEAEKDKLPKEAYKTKTNLTTYKATDTDKATKDTYKIEANVTAAINAIVGIDGENAWTDIYSKQNAVAVADQSGTSAEKEHHIDVPAVAKVDPPLSQDEKLIAALIAAYDNEKADDKKFNTQYKVGDENATGVTTALCSRTGTGTDADPYVYTPTDAGYAALLLELKKDYKGFLTGDVDEKTSTFYTEMYARYEALYINSENDRICGADADPTLLQWTLETLKEDSETDAKSKTTYTKASGDAKFYGKNITKKKNKTGYDTVEASAAKDGAARVKGATADITNTKAKGKFNAVAYLKGVLDAYTTPVKGASSQAGNIVFVEPIFITPALPSAFDAKSLANPTSNKTEAKIEQATVAANASLISGVTAAAWANETGKRNYKIDVAVGKSVKIPFKLADGTEKDLVYEVGAGSSGFTVINGTVKGVDANSCDHTFTSAANTIKVYSQSNPNVYAMISVKVNASVNSVYSNTKSVGMYVGAEQMVSLGTVPATANGTFRYKVTNPASSIYELYDEGDNKVTDGIFNTGVIKIKVADGKTAADLTKAELSVDVIGLGDTTAKTKSPLKISIVPSTAPQDIKSVKTSVKSKEIYTLDGGDTCKMINVPVGGAVNLGYSVLPADADSKFDTPIEVDSGSDVIEVHGDVVTAKSVGVARVAIDPSGATIDGFKYKDTDENGWIQYAINVYEPGSTIVLTDNDYTIKGGNLMTKDDAATNCTAKFTAGEPIIMKAPTSGTSEPIEWKAGVPCAAKIEQGTATALSIDASNYASFGENDQVLRITPVQTGTVKITGTTKYTKQKLAFNVNVTATEGKTSATGTLSYVKDGAAFVPSSTNIKVGDKFDGYIIPTTTDVGGKISFSSADKNILTVTKNGQFVAKAKGSVEITATVEGTDKNKTKLCEVKQTITVNPADVENKNAAVNIGTVVGDTKGAQFSASLKNFDKNTMDLVWTVKSGESTKDVTSFKNQTKLKITDFAAGDAGKTWTVSVQPYVKDSTTEKIGESITIGTVRVYAKAINTATIDNGDADAKKAIANIGKKPDATGAGGIGYGDLYIPVYLTEKDTNKNVIPYSGIASFDASEDIDWTSTNKYLADVTEFIPKANCTDATFSSAENDIIRNYANDNSVGVVKINVNGGSSKYSGQVTIKGVLKNSNKSISIKLNVKDSAKAATIAYDPKAFTDLTGNSGIELVSVQRAETKAKKPLFDLTTDSDFMKLAQATKANKTFTACKYVLVNDTTIKNITKDNWATKVWDPAAAITVGAEDSTTKKSVVKATGTAPAGGSWYLAVADMTYKVTTEYDADTSTPVVYAADTTKCKITKIASKTPIKVAAAATVTYGSDVESGGTTTVVTINDFSVGYDGTYTPGTGTSEYKLVTAVDASKKWSELEESTLVNATAKTGGYTIKPIADETLTDHVVYAVLHLDGDNWKQLNKFKVSYTKSS